MQSLVTKPRIQSGCMNVELIIDENDKVYLIDIGPRAGGNMILIQLSAIFNVDIVEMSIMCAMGEKIKAKPEVKLPYCSHYVLHSDYNGIYREIIFSDEIEKNIFLKKLYNCSLEMMYGFRQIQLLQEVSQ